jgi:O-antigen ligase
MVILLGFTFQGLLSFSRGGMMVGALGILILLFLRDSNKLTNNKVRTNKPLFIGIIALLSLYGVFEVANGITGGNLLLRYQGETAGTLSGSKEVTADHFVTGRLSILEQDIDLWIDNFITGVGVGSSRFLRNLERIGVSPHVELSRLLAEHGLLGFIYSCYFFILIPFQIYQFNQRNIQRAIMMAILTIAILTTFHAAMRTFVTPLFVILASLKIKSDLKTNKLIHKIIKH